MSAFRFHRQDLRPGIEEIENALHFMLVRVLLELLEGDIFVGDVLVDFTVESFRRLL